ncbi:MAG: c-type cytochrome [Acidobacteriota bacterium]|nr:c-type cytochrome [Acidobacteriota bacterium]
MMPGGTIVAVLCAIIVTALPAAALAEPGRGERVYNAHCSWCHGVGGEGGEGPILTRPRLRLAPGDEALRQLIRTGSPRNGMPGVFSINDEELADLASYVRSLGRAEVVDLPGDPQAGAAIYADQGCDSCHIVKGDGVGVGPELTEIGLRRGADHLLRSLLEPETHVDEAYRVMTVTAGDRVAIRGLRIREDPFSVVIRDADNRIRSFRTADVRSIRRRADSSLMPAYGGRMSDKETEHLVAYLASLRGEDSP